MNDADVNEGDKLAFVVKRRQQDADTGNPARFTVRLETDRSGDDWRLEDWTEDTDSWPPVQGLPARAHRKRPRGQGGIHRHVQRTVLSPTGTTGHPYGPSRTTGATN